jgi:hypothetical protein
MPGKIIVTPSPVQLRRRASAFQDSAHLANRARSDHSKCKAKQKPEGQMKDVDHKAQDHMVC